MGAYPPDSTAGPAGGRLGADLAARVEAIVHAAEREARAAEQAIAEHRRSAQQEVARYLAAARLQIDAESAAHAARVQTLSAAARRLTDELNDALAALARELHAADRDLASRLPRTPWPEPAPEPASEPEAAAPPPPEPTWSRIGGERPPESEQPASPTRGAAAPDETASAEAANADRAGGGEDARPAAEGRTGAPGWVGPDQTGPARHGAEAENGERGSTAGAEQAPVPSAARLVAIEMAVGGSSRAEVEQHLRTRLGVAAPEPLLDDVFGVASTAASRLAWGEP